jgi:hypothetical protein
MEHFFPLMRSISETGRGTSCYQLHVSQFSSLIINEVAMTIKLPDDQTLWFRNLPPAPGDEKSHVEYQKSKIGPETELFIDPLTGLVIPIPIIKEEGQ